MKEKGFLVHLSFCTWPNNYHQHWVTGDGREMLSQSWPFILFTFTLSESFDLLSFLNISNHIICIDERCFLNIHDYLKWGNWRNLAKFLIFRRVGINKKGGIGKTFLNYIHSAWTFLLPVYTCLSSELFLTSSNVVPLSKVKLNLSNLVWNVILFSSICYNLKYLAWSLWINKGHRFDFKLHVEMKCLIIFKASLQYFFITSYSVFA